MTGWRVSWTKRAQDDLERVGHSDRERVLAEVDAFAARRSVDLRKLQGRENEWAIRVGSWRVLLQVEGGSATVKAIRPRGSAYRR